MRPVREIENRLTADRLLLFSPQRGSDELSMYNSPMSSISGEFVPTTPDEGRGVVEFCMAASQASAGVAAAAGLIPRRCCLTSRHSHAA